MKKHISFFQRRSVRCVGIIAGSMLIAFVVGVQTAGDVQPIVNSTQANSSLVPGDFNANGTLEIADARIALEIASGYRTSTPDELEADPNGDFHITVEDAMAILEHLERASSVSR